MKDYTICVEDSYNTLSEAVNKMMKEGYVPVGGVMVHTFKKKNHFAQAVALPK